MQLEAACSAPLECGYLVCLLAPPVASLQLRRMQCSPQYTGNQQMGLSQDKEAYGELWHHHAWLGCTNVCLVLDMHGWC